MSAGENLRALLRGLEDELARAGVDSPRLSARLLAAKVLGVEPIEVVLQGETELSPGQADAIRELCRRRAAGEPAAYILGEREFYGLDFQVGPGVLVPRPETEHIVEEVERLFPRNGALTFADFGTGSGALAVTLAHRYPRSRGLAMDMSPAALRIAAANARAHGVAARLLILRGDFTTPIVRDCQLDLVVSNPPYVSEDEYAALSREVADHEPRCALVGGELGTECAEALAPRLYDALRPGGCALVEHGFTQGPAMLDILARAGFTQTRVLQDLAGLDRIVMGKKA